MQAQYGQQPQPQPQQQPQHQQRSPQLVAGGQGHPMLGGGDPRLASAAAGQSLGGVVCYAQVNKVIGMHTFILCHIRATPAVCTRVALCGGDLQGGMLGRSVIQFKRHVVFALQLSPPPPPLHMAAGLGPTAFHEQLRYRDAQIAKLAGELPCTTTGYASAMCSCSPCGAQVLSQLYARR
jgi:hypothetical protein